MIHNTETATESVDTGALVIDGPQPVWMTLNDAREQAFTGEITFEGDPEVLAYLDNGVVYFAERVGDAQLGQRLLDAGVLDATQLERGLVRLGDLEHLGRLFDRDPSINRDAVVVTAELFTEELISDIANRTIANARVVAYRHHPSGLHRWFVAPIDQPVVARPIGAIGQLDGTVIDDLPSLPYVLDDDELMIEWDAMVDTELDIDDVEAMDESEIRTGEITEIITPEEFDADALELSLELAEFVDDADEQVDPPDFELVDIDFDDADTEPKPWTPRRSTPRRTRRCPIWSSPIVDDVDHLDDDVEVPALQMPELEFDDDALVVDHADADTDGEADGDDFEFSVVWPDGSEQLADGAAADLDDSLDVEPTFTETDDGELQFSMPPLTLSDEPEVADAEVPDDVADAVRRAIAAIESASVGEPDVDVDLGDVVPETADVEISHARDHRMSRSRSTPPPWRSPRWRSPRWRSPRWRPILPAWTRSSRRPRLRRRQTASPDSLRRRWQRGRKCSTARCPTMALLSQSPRRLPTLAGQTPAMATSADGSGGQGDERSSALRRLIGSLRRKDH